MMPVQAATQHLVVTAVPPHYSTLYPSHYQTSFLLLMKASSLLADSVSAFYGLPVCVYVTCAFLGGEAGHAALMKPQTP